MSFPHEVIAAFPTGGQPNPELIRAMCTRRFAYSLAADEMAGDFVAKDPVSGIPPLNMIQGGTLFAYDESDSTTAPSDVCLVTNDACRYKSGSVELPNSVLTYSTTVQPADVDVSDGDTFLLPIGATGADWAGKAGQIAIRKGARWYFAISPIGRGLYVEDEDARYYRNASGVWTAGSGSVTLAANAVKITNVLGAKASFVVKVENQTTNTPPASPVVPVAYVIGPSPTGAWASHAGKLAYCLVDGAYTIITPDEGDEVWDKAQNNKYVFNGTAWVSTGGTIIKRTPYRYATDVFTSSATIPFDNTIPQISEGSELYSISYTMRSPSNRINIRLSGFGCVAGANQSLTAALFLNSNANALAATVTLCAAINNPYPILLENEFSPNTSSAFTISIRVGTTSGAVYIGGNSSGRFFGGVGSTVLVIEEIEP